MLTQSFPSPSWKVLIDGQSQGHGRGASGRPEAGRTQRPLGTIPAPEVSLSPAKPADLAATPEEGPGPRRAAGTARRKRAAPTTGASSTNSRKETSLREEGGGGHCDQLRPSETYQPNVVFELGLDPDLNKSTL